MSPDLRHSVLPRLAALMLALSLGAALAACAGSMSPDDSYFLGANRPVPMVPAGVGIAG